MQPQILRLRNYRNVSDLEWEIPLGAVGLCGPNGAGKSTRIGAIEVALFGPQSRSFAPSLKRGESEMQIEMEFEHGGRLLRVRRGYSARSGGKTWLELACWNHDGTDWEPMTRETSKETQALIEGILSMSRASFRSSAYSPQGDGAAWTQCDPAERKRVLAEVLNLGSWDALLAEAKRRRQDIALELAPAKVEASLYEDAVSRASEIAMALGEMRAADLLLAGREEGLAKRLPLLQKDARNAHTEAAQAESRIEAAGIARSRLREAVEQRDEIIARRDEAFRHLDGIEEAQAIAESGPALAHSLAYMRGLNVKAEREYLEAAEAHRESVRVLEAADGEVSRLTALAAAPKAGYLQEVERKKQAEEVGECPTCHQALVGEAHERTLIETGEKCQVLREAYERLMVQVDEAKRARDIVVVSEMPQPAKVLDTSLVEGDLAAAQAAREKVAAADGWREQFRQQELSRIEMDDVTLPALERAVHEAEHLTLTASDSMAVLHAAERALKEATDENDEIRRKRMGTVAEVARLTAELDQAQERARASKEAGARAVELEQSLNVHLLLERAYGKDGVPSLIVETVALPAIQAEANRVLDRLDSSFRVDLRSQRTTKAGDVRDALDIVIHTPTGESLFESLSGGEQERVNIALRFGLSRLLASRRGAEVGIFAIDEPSGLDQDGADRLAVLLKEAAREVFGRVVMVSHQDGLRDALDQTIVVTGDTERLEVAA